MPINHLEDCKTADDFAAFTNVRIAASNSHDSAAVINRINNAMLLIVLRQLERLRGHVDE